jgi:hypothetical protein
MMRTAQDVLMLEAILCALVVRAGGQITLSAVEIRECGNALRLRPRADRVHGNVTLAVEAVEPQANPHPEPGGWQRF